MARILYKITNLINEKCYIGQTKNWIQRMSAHRCGKDPNSLIYKAIKKYGVENFLFEKLAICEDYMIDAAEIKAIKFYNSITPNGYNLEAGGNATKQLSQETKNKISATKKASGYKPTAETITKRSLSLKGKIRTQETKDRISKAKTGSKLNLSEEQRKVLSDRMKGKPAWNKGISPSKEQIAKFSAKMKGRPSGRKGCKMPPEAIEKARQAHLGKSLSEEHKRKIGEKSKGQRHTEETKRKISEHHFGIRPNDETRAKMKESRKKYFEKLKIEKEKTNEKTTVYNNGIMPSYVAIPRLFSNNY